MIYITELNDQNYDEFTKEGIALIDFYADWCAPCRLLSPIINEISSDYNQVVKVGKYNIDFNSNKVNELGIKNIPTIFIYKNGEIADSIYGLVTKDKLKGIIDNHI